MMLGTVWGYTNNLGIRVKIDGENTSTVKDYLWLSSYRPAVNDRVLIEEVGGQYVILGKVTNDLAASSLANNVMNKTKDADDGYVAFGIKGGDLYFGLAPKDNSSFMMYKLAKG